MNTYLKISKFYNKVKQLENISGILSWDTATMMPSKVISYRAADMALLQGMMHKMVVSTKLGDLIEAVDETGLDEWQKANVREIKRVRADSLAVDTQLLQLLTKTSTECEMVWRTARKENNFKMLLPHLSKVVELTKEVAASRASYFKCGQYDALLDMYDPGRKSSDIEQICSQLQKFLPSFIQKVVEKQKANKIKGFGDQVFTPLKQKALGLYCMKKLGFDFTKGRLDISTHPFCGGNSRDTRITTRYDKQDFISGMMGILHETGHALYEQNLPNKYKDQPVGSALGMSVHESQSLFIENYISASRDFVEFIQPKILEIFNVSGDAYSADNLYNTICEVKPSLIRVDADQVTYPAHIILRFKLEKEIMSGNLKLVDLPGAWEDGMQELLGITPNNDSNGCMQDIHWPSGSFGYFPTYLLGAILASQFFAKIKQVIPGLGSEICSGNFKPIVSWLNENIHSKGRLYTVSELVTRATGKDIDVGCYIKYLEDKYLLEKSL